MSDCVCVRASVCVCRSSRLNGFISEADDETL